MYGQNVENQIVGGSSRRRSAEGSQATGWDDLPSHLRPHKDEKGRPLGIYTDNSAIRTTQGFQPIREKFKLLHFARKLLPKERTAHCFYNRITKEEGVSVFLNKLRNKANYGNVMRCANPWACPVCSAIISEGRKDEVKTAMDWWKAQGGDVLLLTLTAPIIRVLTLNP